MNVGGWEVPCSKDKMVKYERHYLIPCSYEDYQTALNDELQTVG